MLTLNRAGLAAGTFLVVVHLAWAGLVSFGVAQSWFDIWLNSHFIQVIYTMKPFDISLLGQLVLINFIVGYILGFGFTAFARMFDKKMQ